MVKHIQGTGTELAFQAEKAKLLDEMHRRQESYMRREDKLRCRVEELEAEVSQLKAAHGITSHAAQKECVALPARTDSYHDLTF